MSFNLDDLMRGEKKALLTAGRDKLLGLIDQLLVERNDLLGALKPKPVDLLGRSEREIRKVQNYFEEGEQQLADDYGQLHDMFDGAHTRHDEPVNIIDGATHDARNDLPPDDDA
jgi:hypothetical protein